MRRMLGLLLIVLLLPTCAIASAPQEEPDSFFSDEDAMRGEVVELDNGYRFEGFPPGSEPAKADDGQWRFGFYAPGDDSAIVSIEVIDREESGIATAQELAERMREEAPENMEENSLTMGETVVERLSEDDTGYLYQIGYLEAAEVILYAVDARQAEPDIGEILSAGHQLYDPNGRKVSAGQYYFDLEFDDALALRVKGLPYGIDARTTDGATIFTLAGFEDEAFRGMTLSYYGLPDGESYTELRAEELSQLSGYSEAKVLSFSSSANGTHFDLALTTDGEENAAPYVFITGTIIENMQLICVLEYDHWTAPWYYHDIAHEIDVGGIEIVTHERS